MVAHKGERGPRPQADRGDLSAQRIAPEQLMLHANRGSSMTSKPVALPLADLGVTRTQSRPHVSHDYPCSEAFKRQSPAGAARGRKRHEKNGASVANFVRAHANLSPKEVPTVDGRPGLQRFDLA
jgi:transposase InsO family protein